MLLDIVKVYLIIGTIVSVTFILIGLPGRITGRLPFPTGKAMLYDCIAHFIDVIVWPYSVVIFVTTLIKVLTSSNPIQYINDRMDDIQDLYDRTNGKKE